MIKMQHNVQPEHIVQRIVKHLDKQVHVVNVQKEHIIQQQEMEVVHHVKMDTTVVVELIDMDVQPVQKEQELENQH